MTQTVDVPRLAATLRAVLATLPAEVPIDVDHFWVLDDDEVFDVFSEPRVEMIRSVTDAMSALEGAGAFDHDARMNPLLLGHAADVLRALADSLTPRD